MLGNSTVYATVAVTDLERSKIFYEQTLGLHRIDQNPGGCMYESGAGRIFVYQSNTAGSGKATCAAWIVDDVERAVNELQSAGVTFENYDIPASDVEGYIYTMGEQKSAWFKDPDGNILNIGSKA